MKSEIKSFCWCGGEENTYTKAAADYIKITGYDYAFMTNSDVVTPLTNRFQIERINVETDWPISLVKFQVCGIMDFRFRKKRERVHAITV